MKRIPLAVLYAAILIAVLVFSVLPGFPPHGYGLAFFVLPVLHWFRFPARRRRILLYLGAIGLTQLAYPDPDLGFLGWFMLWPYLAAREIDDGAAWWKAAYFFGFLRALAGYYWLGNIHATAWLFVVAMSGVAFVISFEACLRFLRFLPYALRGAIGWLLYEWIHTWAFGGFPWLFAGHTQYRYTPLIQIADLMGVPGVSFLVVYVSLALYRFVAARRKSARAPLGELRFAGVLLAANLAYGLFLAPGSIVSSSPAKRGVLMIQSAVPYSVKERGDYSRILNELERLTAEAMRKHRH